MSSLSVNTSRLAYQVRLLLALWGDSPQVCMSVSVATVQSVSLSVSDSASSAGDGSSPLSERMFSTQRGRTSGTLSLIPIPIVARQKSLGTRLHSRLVHLHRVLAREVHLHYRHIRLIARSDPIGAMPTFVSSQEVIG